jgi:hypothetical protein
MHVPFYSTLERPLQFGSKAMHRLHIFGMGSTGVGPKHLGEEKRNVFAVLKFSRAELTVVYYSVDSTNPSIEIASHTVPLWGD